MRTYRERRFGKRWINPRTGAMCNNFVFKFRLYENGKFVRETLDRDEAKRWGKEEIK